jgi:VWFA-related protein
VRAALAQARRRFAASLTISALTATPIYSAPQARQEQPVFKAGTAVVSVDVVVRDSSGAVVRGLTASDFTILEDGRPQQIDTFTFEETSTAPSGPNRVNVLADVGARLRQEVQRTAAASVARPGPMSSSTFAGRRLLVLLFDVSSMEPDDVQRAVDSAEQYVKNTMGEADVVAVATVGTTINVLTDFTSDRETVKAALDKLGYADGTSTPPPAASTVAADEAAAQADAATTDDTGFDAFNNDVRLRALKTIADTLAPIEQKKAVLYFSAGMTRSGDDNQVELRAAINAAVRANVAIYPVDTQGLQAVIPAGDARQWSRSGVSLFSGQGMERQFTALTQSQDTLVSLAADTGGRAFTDTNDFGEAFQRAERDLSSYYLIGYRSTNTAKDGRFRHIQVVVKRKGLKVEARSGYYADLDFAHTNVRDREAQLNDQLAAAVSSTDLPVLVGAGWFRQSADRFYVPIALAVPGSAVPVARGNPKVTLDVRGTVRDEQGRTVGRMKDTLDIPAGTSPTLAGRQVLYQSGATLPPGRFVVKIVVRENTSGTVGSFELPVVVPRLQDSSMKVSPVVLSTQIQPAPVKGRADNPLVRDGFQLLPNLTRVVNRNQKIYFYYEAYDPGVADAAPEVRTSLAFYRGATKVFETPSVDRVVVDEPNRHAVVFQFEVPASTFTPGIYICQINVIDAVAGKAAFPRLTFQIRDSK